MVFEIIRHWLAVSILALALVLWLVLFALMALDADLPLPVRALGLVCFSLTAGIGSKTLDNATWKRGRR